MLHLCLCAVCCLMMMMMMISRYDDSRYCDDDYDDKFLRRDLVVFRDSVVLRWLQQDPVVAVFGWYPVSRCTEVKNLWIISK